jgi:hypothetical protein
LLEYFKTSFHDTGQKRHPYRQELFVTWELIGKTVLPVNVILIFDGKEAGTQQIMNALLLEELNRNPT